MRLPILRSPKGEAGPGRLIRQLRLLRTLPREAQKLRQDQLAAVANVGLRLIVDLEELAFGGCENHRPRHLGLQSLRTTDTLGASIPV